MGFRRRVVGTGNVRVGSKGLVGCLLKDQSPRSGSGWGLWAGLGGLGWFKQPLLGEFGGSFKFSIIRAPDPP